MSASPERRSPRYVPCPTCGLTANDTLIAASLYRNFAAFECPSCHTIYAAHFQDNGLLREVRVV